MHHGWVYVLVNSSIPNMAKVGRTTRSPTDRALELSAATGVATPFVVAFDQAFEDCAEAERVIHAELDRRGLRIALNREFFRGAPSEIIRVVIEVAARSEPAPSVMPHPCADQLRLSGDNALYGRCHTVQDTSEALRLYKLAGMRGSLVAFERMGQIYNELYVASWDRPSRRRALSALQEGARRGNYYCYCEMSVLFTAERNAGNFAKAWESFFARRRDAHLKEVESGPSRFAAACTRYVVQALELRLQPAHRDELVQVPEGIITSLLQQLDVTCSNPTARHLLANALRWSYETLPVPQNIMHMPDQAQINPLPCWVSHTPLRPPDGARRSRDLQHQLGDPILHIYQANLERQGL